MGFRATDVGSSEDEDEIDPEARKKRAQKLTEALAVLAIRPPQFHSLSRACKLEPVRHKKEWYKKRVSLSAKQVLDVVGKLLLKSEFRCFFLSKKFVNLKEDLH